ncbi:hypothetical protein M885DRAFT_517834 [Pelagophyceae sp. CCMP2097]|nr:hypothetical protein M885DRAFT_517834 [Pelagophyceae sp. CCMP2097]
MSCSWTHVEEPEEVVIADGGGTCGIFTSMATSPGAKRPDVDVPALLRRINLADYIADFDKAGFCDAKMLAKITDADLDALGMRKLEKRKLMHHVNRALRPKDDDSGTNCY